MDAIGEEQCLQRCIGRHYFRMAIGEAALWRAVQRTKLLRSGDQYASELVNPAKWLDVEHLSGRSDEQVDCIGHDAAAIRRAIGKGALRRQKDAIPAIVELAERALDFVNLSFG